VSDNEFFLTRAQLLRHQELLDLLHEYTEELIETRDPERRRVIWDKYMLARREIGEILPPAPNHL